MHEYYRGVSFASPVAREQFESFGDKPCEILHGVVRVLSSVLFRVSACGDSSIANSGRLVFLGRDNVQLGALIPLWVESLDCVVVRVLSCEGLHKLAKLSPTQFPSGAICLVPFYVAEMGAKICFIVKTYFD